MRCPAERAAAEDDTLPDLRSRLALVAVLAGALLFPTAPQPGTAQDAATTCAPTAGGYRAAAARVYADKHWRTGPIPGALERLHAAAPCSPGSGRIEARERAQFRRWRAYRLIVGNAPGAPAGGYPSGCSSRWLRYTSVPGYVVRHESGCSWTAANPSGACGPYQLLGWTSCDTSSWADKMRHHRTAAYVLRVQGLGPAWTSNW